MQTDEMTRPQQHRLITLAGPTAVGKTAVAIRLAQRLDADILSADSRQVYKEMNVGVARPEPAELAAVRHHFIADRSIYTHCTAAQYAREAAERLAELFHEMPTVVCAGGSGLWAKALLEGFDEIPNVPVAMENALEAELGATGIEPLQRELVAKDAAYAARVDLNNPRRVMRALSVIRHTGRPFSSYLGQRVWNPAYQQVNVVLTRDRTELYDRINRRVDLMMQAGLLAEAEQLYPHRHLRALQTVGYQELFDFMDEKCTLAYAVDKIKQHSRNYAKRQLTWYRRQGNWQTLDLTGRTDEEVDAALAELIDPRVQ